MTDEHAPGDQPSDPPDELDLSAWEPPPPPAGLADAIIARARAHARTPDRVAPASPRSGLALAAIALVVSLVAIAGEVALHGATLFVDEPAAEPASIAEIEAIHAQIGRVDGELAQLRARLDAAPAPTPEPAPAPPRLLPIAGSGDTGQLVVSGAPAAQLLIDGERVGSTPWSGQVAAGRHKLTYMIGADRYSFHVQVKPGGTTSISKDFAVPP